MDPSRYRVTRRSLLALSGVTLATRFVRADSNAPIVPARIKAVAFDAFAIFDSRPVWGACESAFPGQGSALSSAWRSRQFEYQWLGALAGRYRDFWQTTENALVFAARSTGLNLTAGIRATLLQAFLRLPAWPDVAKMLSRLKSSGRQTLILSNATRAILDASLRTSGLEEAFDHVLSTDAIATVKPDPRAYRLALEASGHRREEILFVAFAGWDAAGARWFGYPTFWNNRLGAPAEELEAPADASGASLDTLAPLLQLP
jgi:2-haloacid dehalogenase